MLRHTDQTLLAGESATNFATQLLKLHRTSLTTNTSETMWKKWLNNSCQPNYWVDVYPDSTKSCGPYSLARNRGKIPHRIQETRTGITLALINLPNFVLTNGYWNVQRIYNRMSHGISPRILVRTNFPL